MYPSLWITIIWLKNINYILSVRFGHLFIDDESASFAVSSHLEGQINQLIELSRRERSRKLDLVAVLTF